MKTLLPHELKDLHEVAEYWAQCLRRRPEARSDKVAAGWIVGVVSNDKELEWSEGENADPDYAIVFELAADMEWQEFPAEWQKRNWEAIERHVRRLQKRYPKPTLQNGAISAKPLDTQSGKKTDPVDYDYDDIHTFYIEEVLPHFGVTDNNTITWKHVDVMVDNHESIHWFEMDAQQYALVFEDYQAFDESEALAHIEQTVRASGQTFEYVLPISSTGASPSYQGYESKGSGYIPDETGIFTLVKLIDKK